MKAKKIVILAAAFVLVAAMAVAGTLAWLTATSESVTNTFKATHLGEVQITETSTTKEFLVTPGVDIEKDPELDFTRTINGVAIEAGYDVDAYVFVEITSTNWKYNAASGKYELAVGNDADALSFAIDSGWTRLADDKDVYYKEVAKGDGLTDVAIISNDTITVAKTITESDIADAASTLTFKPYAIQKAGFTTVADAWTAVK